MSEPRDQMDASNDLVRIQECEHILWIIKTDARVLLVLKTRRKVSIMTKPPHIEEWDLLYAGEIRPQSMMMGANMKYANYMAIPERMRVSRVCLMGICHKVGMSMWIE